MKISLQRVSDKSNKHEFTFNTKNSSSLHLIQHFYYIHRIKFELFLLNLLKLIENNSFKEP